MTLQAAITGQLAVPTTQGTSTNIRISDTFAWVFADAAGNAAVSIAGDGSVSVLDVVGGATATGAGQGVRLTTGPSTTAGQSSGAFAVTIGAVTDGPTGGFSFTGANAVGVARAAGDWSVILGDSTTTQEGADYTILAGGGGTTGSGGDIDERAGRGGTTTGAGGNWIRASGLAGGTTGASGNITDIIPDGSPAGSNVGSYSCQFGFAQGGNASAGTWNITGADAVGTGQGTRCFIQAGGNPTGTGPAGEISLSGLPTATGVPTSILLTAGSVASGTNDGGMIDLTPGQAGGTGNQGMTRMLGALSLGATSSPAALAAGATNNYAPANGTTSNVLRLTPNAAGSALTGLTGGNGRSGRLLAIHNINATPGATLTLNHNDAGSTAANRFFCSNNLPAVIQPNGTALLIYDDTSDCWRVILTS